MTSCVAAWLSRNFRSLFHDSNRGSFVRGLRQTPPCLEALESRNLLTNASGVWSFASAPGLHPMKVNIQTLNPARPSIRSSSRRTPNRTTPVNWLAKPAH